MSLIQKNKRIQLLVLSSVLVSLQMPMIANAEAIKVKNQGRKPSSQLTYRQSGVPIFQMVQKKGSEVIKVKNIPQLDIGEEKQIEADEYQVQIPEKNNLKVSELRKKQSPKTIEIPTDLNLGQVSTSAKKITSLESVVQVPLVKDLEFIPDPLIAETKPEVTNLVEIKPDEFKMLQALIFLEYQNKYDLAMSLFVELMDVPQFRAQALYHYAETARAQKLSSEFRQKMIQVTTETKDNALKKMAVESLIKNISDLEISDIGLIDPLAEAFQIETSTNSAYLLKKAKYYSEKGNLGEFENALVLIPMTSPEYHEATLLKAVFNYRQGQVDAAILDLEGLWPMIENQKKDQVRNLAALTLARLYFQKGDYKSAYKNYLHIDKSSGQWLQGMVEQAWTQVLAGDNEGAAGNMFSLHTDFFKKAYAPDTYIVRTVGYLNLCQYGDGLNVLDDLKKKYSSINEKLKGFQTENKESIKYYDLVKLWMKNTNLEEVDGVPRAFIVELARHPSYMSAQKQINNYEDENSRFNKITIDLIRKERAARLEMLKAKNALSAARRDGKKNTTDLEKKFLAVGVEQVIYSRAREGIKKMREAAVARLQKEENSLRLKVALNLQKRYKQFTASLDNLIDQKEVLSYEIYSGAGEHIRFQMAGGEIKDDRAPANITPTEKDSYSWKHKGEVWEDEIGHYRSALKNVCPSEDVAQNSN
jgi:hypothetical protein